MNAEEKINEIKARIREHITEELNSTPEERALTEERNMQSAAKWYADVVAEYYGIPRECVHGYATRRADGGWDIHSDVCMPQPAESICIQLQYDQEAYARLFAEEAESTEERTNEHTNDKTAGLEMV